MKLRAESGLFDALESEMRLPDGGSEPIERARDQLLSQCTDCGACKRRCAFLEQHGTPREIAAGLDFSEPDFWKIAYECSLCGFCAAVCPEKADPVRFFSSIRREAVASRQVDLLPYKVIISYEKRGTSPLFSYYALPEGCGTVFFPGCTLPGTRPETTWRLFRHLQEGIPSLGIVLDCCTKPSHDLGRQGHFVSMFAEMRRYLAGNGVGEVLVACPNCYQIFKRYGDGLKVRTVYEVINAGDLPAGSSAKGELAVHDPCPLRADTDVQDAARSILVRMGLGVAEMRHRRRQTFCCGEGGSVGFVRPELAREWGRKRRDEAAGRKVVTYCAGCAAFLSRLTPTVHLADVLFFPERALNGGLRVSASPFTYIHRLKLKRRFKRALLPVVERVRPCRAEAILTARGMGIGKASSAELSHGEAPVHSSEGHERVTSSNREEIDEARIHYCGLGVGLRHGLQDRKMIALLC